MTEKITQIDRLVELEPHLTKQRKLYRSVNLTGLDTEIILGAIAELKGKDMDAIKRLNRHLDTFKYSNDVMTIVQIRDVISAPSAESVP